MATVMMITIAKPSPLNKVPAVFRIRFHHTRVHPRTGDRLGNLSWLLVVLAALAVVAELVAVAIPRRGVAQ